LVEFWYQNVNFSNAYWFIPLNIWVFICGDVLNELGFDWTDGFSDDGWRIWLKQHFGFPTWGGDFSTGLGHKCKDFKNPSFPPHTNRLLQLLRLETLSPHEAHSWQFTCKLNFMMTEEDILLYLHVNTDSSCKVFLLVHFLLYSWWLLGKIKH